ARLRIRIQKRTYVSGINGRSCLLGVPQNRGGHADNVTALIEHRTATVAFVDRGLKGQKTTSPRELLGSPGIAIRGDEGLPQVTRCLYPPLFKVTAIADDEDSIPWCTVLRSEWQGL